MRQIDTFDSHLISSVTNETNVGFAAVTILFPTCLWSIVADAEVSGLWFLYVL